MLTIEQINNLEEENKKLRKANDEKNELLTLCGVHAGGERKRVTFIIKQLRVEKEQLKKVLKDIRAMVDFECECGRGEMCICNVCDKYDAIIEKIDGALKEDADK